MVNGVVIGGLKNDDLVALGNVGDVGEDVVVLDDSAANGGLILGEVIGASAKLSQVVVVRDAVVVVGRAVVSAVVNDNELVLLAVGTDLLDTGDLLEVSVVFLAVLDVAALVNGGLGEVEGEDARLNLVVEVPLTDSVPHHVEAVSAETSKVLPRTPVTFSR